MRDPNRIYPLCLKIAELWEQTCPDLRFMQLMSNFADWRGAVDPFYMEDDEFLTKFKEYIERMNYTNGTSDM